MSYTKEKQSYYKKNKLSILVMMNYIDDFDFLYQCIGIDNEYIIEDVEDIIISLLDFQGDNVYYTPLTLA